MPSKTATADMEAELEDTRHGVDGTVKWHNSTGPWGLMEGETLEVQFRQNLRQQVSLSWPKRICPAAR